MNSENGVVIFLMAVIIFTACFCTFQVQTTNRDFIKKGYSQIQKQHSVDFLWQLK